MEDSYTKACQVAALILVLITAELMSFQHVNRLRNAMRIQRSQRLPRTIGLGADILVVVAQLKFGQAICKFSFTYCSRVFHRKSIRVHPSSSAAFPQNLDNCVNAGKHLVYEVRNRGSRSENQKHA